LVGKNMLKVLPCIVLKDVVCIILVRSFTKQKFPAIQNAQHEASDIEDIT